MHPIIEQMLNLQPMETTSDRKNGMKEVIQEIVLSGLSRAGFFSTKWLMSDQKCKTRDLCLLS
jgi:hypothetical protein